MLPKGARREWGDTAGVKAYQTDPSLSKQDGSSTAVVASAVLWVAEKGIERATAAAAKASFGGGTRVGNG